VVTEFARKEVLHLRTVSYEVLPERVAQLRRCRLDPAFVRAVLSLQGPGVVAGPLFEDRHEAERFREAHWRWFFRNYPQLRCSTRVIPEVGGWRVVARVEPRGAGDG
jgi:hypothetical protein